MIYARSDGKSEPFNISAGVVQGDTFVPNLFVIVLDYSTNEALDGKEETFGFQLVKRQGRWIGPKVLADLDFAVNIDLLPEEVRQAQELLFCRVETSAAKVGLKMSSGKIKYNVSLY